MKKAHDGVVINRILFHHDPSRNSDQVEFNTKEHIQNKNRFATNQFVEIINRGNYTTGRLVQNFQSSRSPTGSGDAIQSPTGSGILSPELSSDWITSPELTSDRIASQLQLEKNARTEQLSTGKREQVVAQEKTVSNTKKDTVSVIASKREGKLFQEEEYNRHPVEKDSHDLLLPNPYFLYVKEFLIDWFSKFSFRPSAFTISLSAILYLVAVSSTLQKKEGTRWLKCLLHTKLPGYTTLYHNTFWETFSNVRGNAINRYAFSTNKQDTLKENVPAGLPFYRKAYKALTYKDTTSSIRFLDVYKDKAFVYVSSPWEKQIRKDYVGFFVKKPFCKEAEGQIVSSSNLMKARHAIALPWYRIDTYNNPHRTIIPVSKKEQRWASSDPFMFSSNHAEKDDIRKEMLYSSQSEQSAFASQSEGALHTFLSKSKQLQKQRKRAALFLLDTTKNVSPATLLNFDGPPASGAATNTVQANRVKTEAVCSPSHPNFTYTTDTIFGFEYIFPFQTSKERVYVQNDSIPFKLESPYSIDCSFNTNALLENKRGGMSTTKTGELFDSLASDNKKRARTITENTFSDEMYTPAFKYASQLFARANIAFLGTYFYNFQDTLQKFFYSYGFLPPSDLTSLIDTKEALLLKTKRGTLHNKLLNEQNVHSADALPSEGDALLSSAGHQQNRAELRTLGANQVDIYAARDTGYTTGLKLNLQESELLDAAIVALGDTHAKQLALCDTTHLDSSSELFETAHTSVDVKQKQSKGSESSRAELSAHLAYTNWPMLVCTSSFSQQDELKKDMPTFFRVPAENLAGALPSEGDALPSFAGHQQSWAKLGKTVDTALNHHDSTFLNRFEKNDILVTRFMSGYKFPDSTQLETNSFFRQYVFSRLLSCCFTHFSQSYLINHILLHPVRIQLPPCLPFAFFQNIAFSLSPIVSTQTHELLESALTRKWGEREPAFMTTSSGSTLDRLPAQGIESNRLTAQGMQSNRLPAQGFYPLSCQAIGFYPNIKYKSICLHELSELKNVFVQLGRKYEEYLNVPKETPLAIRISPSLEDDITLKLEAEQKEKRDDERATTFERLQKLRLKEQKTELGKKVRTFAYKNKLAMHSVMRSSRENEVRTDELSRHAPWEYERLCSHNPLSDRKYSFFGRKSVPTKRLVAQEQKEINDQIVKQDFCTHDTSLRDKIKVKEIVPTESRVLQDIQLHNAPFKERKGNYSDQSLDSSGIVSPELSSDWIVSQCVQKHKTISYKKLQRRARKGLIKLLGSPGVVARHKTGVVHRSRESERALRGKVIHSAYSHLRWHKKRFRSRVLSTPCTRHLVMPAIRSNDWKKMVEWQLKNYLFLEEKRLAPLLKENPDKHFKIKQLQIYLPWVTIRTAANRPFQWPLTRLDYAEYTPFTHTPVKVISFASDRKPKTVPVQFQSPNSSGDRIQSLDSSGIASQSLDSSGIASQSLDSSGIASQSLDSSGIASQSLVTTNTHSISLPLRKLGNDFELPHYKATEYWDSGKSVSLSLSPFNPLSMYPQHRKDEARRGNLFEGLRTDGRDSPSKRMLCQNDSELEVQSRNELHRSSSLSKKPIISLPLLSFASSQGQNGIAARSTHETYLCESVTHQSWLFLYRLFLAFALKQFLQYIYRVSLKDFIIKTVNSDMGLMMTSPQFRDWLQQASPKHFYTVQTRLQDVAVVDDTLPILSEIIWYLRSSGPGQTGSRALLVVAPSGADTTSVVQAIAGECGLPIVVQSMSALALSYDEPYEQLENVFAVARQQAPCVLFLDDLDLIGQSRTHVTTNDIGSEDVLFSLDSYTTEGKLCLANLKRADSLHTHLVPHAGVRGGTVSSRWNFNPLIANPVDQPNNEANVEQNEQAEESLITQSGQSFPISHHNLEYQTRRTHLLLRLLTEMDGIAPLHGVVIVATSEQPALLDPALLRAGRFERKIHLSLPNREKRIQLLKLETQKIGRMESLPWEYLSARTAHMNGADILSAINHSAIRAILNNTFHTLETLEHGLQCVTGGENTRVDTSVCSQNDPFHISRLAFYQAGKAVVHNVLPDHPQLGLCTLYSDSGLGSNASLSGSGTLSSASQRPLNARNRSATSMSLDDSILESFQVLVSDTNVPESMVSSSIGSSFQLEQISKKGAASPTRAKRALPRAAFATPDRTSSFMKVAKKQKENASVLSFLKRRARPVVQKDQYNTNTTPWKRGTTFCARTRTQFESRLVGLYAGKAGELLHLSSHVSVGVQSTQANSVMFSSAGQSKSKLSKVAGAKQGSAANKFEEQVLSKQFSLSNRQEFLAQVVQSSIRSAWLWQSHLGFSELFTATSLIHVMIERWYLYSQNLLTYKTNTLIPSLNHEQMREERLFPLAQRLARGLELDSIQSSFWGIISLGGDHSVHSSTFKQNNNSDELFQNKQSCEAHNRVHWWQAKMCKALEMGERPYGKWYRIYLPKIEEREHNEEWVPPDSVIHQSFALSNLSSRKIMRFNGVNSRLMEKKECTHPRAEEASSCAVQPMLSGTPSFALRSRKLAEQSVGAARYITSRTGRSFHFVQLPLSGTLVSTDASLSLKSLNDLYLFERDTAYQNAITNSFYTAFHLLHKNRQLVDLLADHLVRFKKVRSYEISKMCSFFSCSSLPHSLMPSSAQRS